MEVKNIVIIGAGFGGLRTARVLGKALKRQGVHEHYRVILIDRNIHHTYTPLLYEVATTSKKSATSAEITHLAGYDIPLLVKGLPVDFLQDEVIKLELEEGNIYLRTGIKIHTDYLVLALGSETDYFNIPGAKEHSLPLKTLRDALKVRDTLYQKVMEGNEGIHVLVVGGGSTGVELSAELREWCFELKREFKSCDFSVSLLERSEEILPGFGKFIQKTARKRLEKLGVHLLTNTAITKIEENIAHTASGASLPFHLLVWAGGVRPPAVIHDLPLKQAAHGRIEVENSMGCLPLNEHLKLSPKVYAIGDIVCVLDTQGKPMPGVARAAIAEADIVAQNILAEILGDKKLGYYPKHYPYIIPVGGKYAIAKFGAFITAGFFAWILKCLVELNYLFSIMGFRNALKIWLKAIKVFIQNDRLG